MIDIKNMIEMWKKAIKEEGDKPTSADIIIDTWEPRFSWFRPPMWKIFRWAYKHHYTKFCNCYPTSIHNSIEESYSDNSIELEFNAYKVESPEIESMANKLKENIDRWRC